MLRGGSRAVSIQRRHGFAPPLLTEALANQRLPIGVHDQVKEESFLPATPR